MSFFPIDLQSFMIKVLRQLSDSLLKKGNRGHHNLRMWRKERWLRLSPKQVMCMLWKNNLLISRLTVISDIIFKLLKKRINSHNM
ncbi:hypothetical protein AB205_0128850 [Aquarana catesbeiana]|uniref:Uncharacterized protein n=2 Tax=Aquarana catesbeiana TaxID=8400 RepID=A0A2G9RYH0_AQUCT|nr:hypothetical protein AB205_0128850 [Aquarana catesbeiana]